MITSEALRRMSLFAALCGGTLLICPPAMAQDEAGAGEPKQAPPATEPELTPQQIEEMMCEPPSHLAEMPAVRFDSSRHEPTTDQQREIAQLIGQLTQIDKPDYGMAPWMSGSQFAPIKSSQQFGAGVIMVDHGLQTSDALLKLVEFGPKALPALLDALNDATPTKHKMEHGGGFGGMWYGREVAINAAHPKEAAVKQAHPDFFKAGDLGGFDKNIDEHAITRGDVCFTIIGQIVNRNYQASRYQPTACNVINSPTHDPELAKVVRGIWDSNDPAETLVKSLMADFHTRGGAAHYQAGAAMRLLYYFPGECTDLIIERLNTLNATSLPDNATEEQWNLRREANGDIEPVDLIKAVSFSDDPRIVQATLRLVQQIDQPYTLHECLNERIVAADPEMIFRKLQGLLDNPEPANGFVGAEFWPLHMAAKYYPDRARPMFEQCLEQDTTKVKLACINAVAGLKPPPEWALVLLVPLFDDRTPTGMQYGPEYDRKPMLMCDYAAERLARHIENAPFKLEGERADVDRQIGNLKRRVAGEPVTEIEKVKIDFDAVPKVQPLASFAMPSQIGRIYGFSDEKTLYAGFGYQANCWAYDTLTINVATGQQTGRTKLDEWKGAVAILHPIVGEIAMCFHNEAGGDIITRDIRTGRELHRISTPYHESLDNDPLRVRGLGDIFLTGDGKSAVAFTPDGSLHTVDLATGERKIPWKIPGEPSWKEVGFHGSLIPVDGTNRVILELFGEDGQPLRVWDQDTQQMSEVHKVPDGGWRSAWGKYACNHMNNNIVFWDFDACKPLELPLPEGAMITDLTCDSDQTVLLVSMSDGPVWVIDLKTLKPVARLEMPRVENARVSVSLSNEDRL